MRIFRRPLEIHLHINSKDWSRVYINEKDMRDAAYEGIMRALSDFRDRHGDKITEIAAAYCEDVTEDFLTLGSDNKPRVGTKWIRWKQ